MTTVMERVGRAVGMVKYPIPKDGTRTDGSG